MRQIVKAILQIIATLAVFYAMKFYVPLETPTFDEVSIISSVFLAIPYAFTGVLLLNRPIDMISRIVNLFDNRYLSWFSWYRWISTIVSIAPFLFIASAFPRLIINGEDPLIAQYWTGHWFVWLILSILIIKFGYKDLIKGIFAASFIYAAHEGDWLISSIAQFSSPVYTGEPFQRAFWGVFRDFFYGYAPLTFTILTILFAYYLGGWRVYSTKKEILIIAVPAIWGALQLFVSFPNTLAFGNATPFFANPIVNGVEVLSWVIPVIIAFWPLKLSLKSAVSLYTTSGAN